jgi:predicted Zn-dependent protease with MMP-like domain
MELWVRRKLRTAEEELDGLDQPEESGNQVNVTFVTADGVNEHVVPELVLPTPVSAGKPDFRNFMAPTLTDFDDMVQAAFTVLSKKYTHLCDAVMIQVKDFPDQETLEKVHSKNQIRCFGYIAPNLRQRIRLPDTCPIGFFSIGILSSIFGRDVRSRWMRLLLMFWCMEIGHHFGLSDEDMRVIEGRE